MNTLGRSLLIKQNIVLLLMLAWSAAAQAQTEAVIPPRATSISPTGVNFKSGAFTISGTDLSIGGPGVAGLSLMRSYASPNTSLLGAPLPTSGWAVNTSAAVYRTEYVYPPDEEVPPNGPPPVWTALTGTGSYRFWGNGLAPYALDGNTLTASGGNFTFTDRNGAIYFYSGSSSTSKNLQSVTYPDGTKLDYTYTPNRMVISNRGYALLWESTTKVCVINMAEYYVTNTMTTCPAGAQTVTFTITAGNLTGSTNAAGQTTTYEYNADFHLSCVKDPGQSVCRISNTYNHCANTPPGGHNPLDQVISQTTGTGETYTYSYNFYGQDPCGWTGYGATTTMTGPGGATSVVSTDGSGSAVAITDPLSRTTLIDYDGANSVGDPILFASQTESEGNLTSVVRDSRGNITQVWRKAKPGTGAPDVEIALASYPATCTNRKTCNKPDYTLDANGNRTDYTYDPTHGGVLTITRPAAVAGGIRPQIRYGYTQLYAWIKNSSGAYVQASTPVWLLTSTSQCRTLASCAGTADEIKTMITYGSTGAANNLLPTSVSVGAGDASLVATTTTTYDFTGNAITIDGPLPGSADTTRFRYDALRRVVGIVGPDPDGAGALKNRAIRKTYDASGNLTKLEHGTVNSQSDADWPNFLSLQAVDMSYDVMGRVLKITKSSGGTTYAVLQTSYDSAGRQECTALRMDPAQWNSQTNACIPQTTASNGPDQVSRNVYNLADELTKVQLAVGLGAPTEVDDETLTYSANARVSTVTDGLGNTTTYSYDAYDRLNKSTYADSSYEQTTEDWNGNVLSQRLRDGQTIYLTYDNLDRLKLKDLPAPETDVTYSSYDLQGNLLQMSSTQTISFSYDALGHKKSETGSLGTMSFDFDLVGRRTKTTWPDGFFVTYDRLTTGEVQNVRENGSSILGTYSYDDMGSRTGLSRLNGASTTFLRDPISRLATLSHDLAAASQDVSTTFAYLPSGQISSSVRDNDLYAWAGHYNQNQTDTFNSLNQITVFGATSVAYDGRGNIASVGASAYGYSVENSMTSAPGGATLDYEPTGRLYQTSKAGTSTRFQYDGDTLVAEYNSSNVLQRRYVFGPGANEPLVWYEGSGVGDRRWYHQDERGTIVSISNNSGASIATNTYDEYGIPSASNLGRFGYTGQAWIPEVSLYYYKARMYSPSIGRFMQSDPIGYAAGMNTYAYVGGDPVNATDPSGLWQRPGDEPRRGGPCDTFACNYSGEMADFTDSWHAPNVVRHRDGQAQMQRQAQGVPLIPIVRQVWKFKGMAESAFRTGPSTQERIGEWLGLNPSVAHAAESYGSLKVAQTLGGWISKIGRTGYRYNFIGMGNRIYGDVRGIGVLSEYSLTATARFGMVGLAFLGGFAFGTAIDQGLQAADICTGCSIYNATHDDNGNLLDFPQFQPGAIF